MSTTITTTKNMPLPLAITQEIADIMLDSDTRWINENWDGTTETMRDGINAGNYQHYPFMLYGGNRAQRHELHRKLGSNFVHTSIDMDDGSRIMIIINKEESTERRPGWIFTGDDLSVCFFTGDVPWHGTHWLPKDDPDRIQAEARTRVYKMGPRKVAMYLPQQQYESKSDAEKRMADAKTLDTWRQRANFLIGDGKPKTQEEQNVEMAAKGLVSLSQSTPETSLEITPPSPPASLDSGAAPFAPRNAVEKRPFDNEPTMEKRQKTERTKKHFNPPHTRLVREIVGDPSNHASSGPDLSPQHSIDPSLKMAIMVCAADFNGAITLAEQSKQPIPINSIEGCVLSGDWARAARLSLHKIIDINRVALSIRRKQRQEQVEAQSPSSSSEQSYERGAEAHIGYSPPSSPDDGRHPKGYDAMHFVTDHQQRIKAHFAARKEEMSPPLQKSMTAEVTSKPRIIRERKM